MALALNCFKIKKYQIAANTEDNKVM